MSYRVLVTGSRTWEDVDLIHGVLNLLLSELGSFTLVHGACPRGTDKIADEWGRNVPDVKVEPHPADWRSHDPNCKHTAPPNHLRRGYCPKAGFRRNTFMVRLGADVCLAFIRDASRGATHCAEMAELYGIEVRRWTA